MLIDSTAGAEVVVRQERTEDSLSATPQALTFSRHEESYSSDSGPTNFEGLSHAPPRQPKSARVHPYLNTHGASRNAGSSSSLGAFESRDAMSSWSSGSSADNSGASYHGGMIGGSPALRAARSTPGGMSSGATTRRAATPPPPPPSCLWTPDVCDFYLDIYLFIFIFILFLDASPSLRAVAVSLQCCQ